MGGCSARASLQLKLMTMLEKLLVSFIPNRALSPLCSVPPASYSFASDVLSVKARKPSLCPPLGQCRRVLSLRSRISTPFYVHV